jgi:hypothetical protein
LSIGLLNKDETEIKLMNWLDVGRIWWRNSFYYSTRNIQSDKFSTRFGFKLVEDFSYLMLMTDGIYDQEICSRNQFGKIENWKDLLEDLKGKTKIIKSRFQ